VKLEYGPGYALVGMSDNYSMRMLGQEFCAHMGEDRGLYPSISYRRETDDTVVHQTATDWHEESLYYMLDLPERYQEDAGRCTEINLRSDQLRVLDYSAQAGQTALVRVSLFLDNHTVEYWLHMSIDPIADEPLDTYLANLQAQWKAKIREISPGRYNVSQTKKYALRSGCAFRKTL
jgi:hypothetical protein